MWFETLMWKRNWWGRNWFVIFCLCKLITSHKTYINNIFLNDKIKIHLKLELPTLLIAAWALRHTCIYLFIYFVSRLLQRTGFLTPLNLSSSLLAFPHTHTSLPVSTSSVIFFFKLKFLYHQTTKQFSSNLPTDQSTPPPPPLPNLHNKIF